MCVCVRDNSQWCLKCHYHMNRTKDMGGLVATQDIFDKTLLEELAKILISGLVAFMVGVLHVVHLKLWIEFTAHVSPEFLLVRRHF